MQKTKIKKWLKIFILVTAAIAAFVGLALVAHAADVAASDADKAQFSALTKLQEALEMVLWPLLKLSGGLMDNSLLFDFGMEQKILAIWVPIRNMVNIFFVIGLVGIALYNVLGIGGNDGGYTIKAILPKVIIGIIAINFSFVGIKVVLDVVNVLTVSVFALPTELSVGEILPRMSEPQKKQLCDSLSGLSKDGLYQKYPDDSTGNGNMDNAVKMAYRPQMAEKACAGDATCLTGIIGVSKDPESTKEPGAYDTAVGGKFTKDEQKTSYQNMVDAQDKGQWCAGHNPIATKFNERLAKFDENNAALAMAVTMGNVLNFNKLDIANKTVEDISISLLFSLIMYIIYAGAFVSLVAVLLERLVVMWVTIVLSPILLVALVIEPLKAKMGEFGSLSQKFVKNAVAPLIIGLFMSVGWIMITAIQGNLNSTDSFVSVGTGIPVKGLNTLQDIIVSVGAVVVVWVGVFSAAKDTFVAGKITGAISGALQSAGAWVGKLPLKHIPVGAMKTGTGKQLDAWTGIMSLPKIMTGFQNKQAEEEQATADYFLKKRGMKTGGTTVNEAEGKTLGKTFDKPRLETLGTEKADEGLKEELKKTLKKGEGDESYDALKNGKLLTEAEAYVKAVESKKPEDIKAAGEALKKKYEDVNTTAPVTAKQGTDTKAATSEEKAAKINSTSVKIDKAGDVTVAGNDKKEIVNSLGCATVAEIKELFGGSYDKFLKAAKIKDDSELEGLLPPPAKTP